MWPIVLQAVAQIWSTQNETEADGGAIKMQKQKQQKFNKKFINNEIDIN